MSQAKELWAEVRQAPIRVKIVVGLAVLYLLSPIDLIPDFIPVIGQADDALLVAWLVRYIKKMSKPT